MENVLLVIQTKNVLLKVDDKINITGRFFVTGTMAYGPATDDSDLDVVVYKEDALALLHHVKNYGYSYKQVDEYETTGGFKCILSPILPTINIVSVGNDMDWYAWWYATNKMKELPPIINREERIKTFQRFQAVGLYIYSKNTKPLSCNESVATKTETPNLAVKTVGFTESIDKNVVNAHDYGDYEDPDDDTPF